MSWYQWIAEVFQKPSDIAQFLAIFISSIVAISVVLLNQFFNRRSARRSLYIEKIECLYQSILAARSSSLLFLNQLYSGFPKEGEITRLFDITSDHIRDAEVFAHLYFPEVKLNATDIIILLTTKKEKTMHLPIAVKVSRRQRQLPKDIIEVNSQYDLLAQECKRIIERFKH